MGLFRWSLVDGNILGGKNEMIKSYDVGSLPPKMKQGEIRKLFLAYEENADSRLSRHLEEIIVEAFLDKASAGTDIPNYPQFRDMNEMFLQMISGIEKLKEGYVEVESLSLKSGKSKIPEVHIIERNSEKIYETLNRNFKLKVCITGHYTLSALFAYKNEKTFLNLGKVLAEIAKENIFENKY